MKKFLKNKKIYLYATIFLIIIYAFTISHIDCNTITTWGYDLLESIRLGCLRNFPVYTYETHNMATNYSLFANVITAVWLSPIYLLSILVGKAFNILVFDVWYKCFVLLMTVFASRKFSKILSKLDVVEEKQKRGQILFLTSAILLVTVLGKGQIDIISLCFVLLAVENQLECRYGRMAVLFGLSMVIKPFSVLIIVPIYLLLISKRSWKIILSGAITIIPYAFDFLMTHILMPRYYEMKAITSREFAETFGQSRVDQLFNANIHGVLIYWALVILICFVCLRIGLSHQAQLKHYIFLPTLMYGLFALLVNDTCYWFILILPVLIYMGLVFNRVSDFYILNFGMNMGVVIYTFFLEGTYRPGVNYSILNLLNPSLEKEASLASQSQYQVYAYEIGQTIFVACMLIIIALYGCERFIVKNEDKEEIVIDNKLMSLLKWLQPVPVIAYLLLAYFIAVR